MVRYREKRVIKNSKENIVLTYANIARGKIVTLEKGKFIIRSSVDNPKKDIEGKVTQNKIIHVIQNDDGNYSYFQDPDIKYDVLLKYNDKKSKFGEYKDDFDNLPAEVLTLSGKLLYRKDIIN